MESEPNKILEEAKTKEVSLLIIGDALCATTHMDLYLQAKEQRIPCRVIHNASVISAVGMTGLQVYKFGKITSIPFDNKDVETPYTVLKENKSLGLHTLFLLDLRPDEGKAMTIKEALEFLLSKEKGKKEGIVSEDVLAIGCSRLGSEDQSIISGTIKELMKAEFGKPPHCLIIPGKLHFREEEALQAWKA